MAPPFGTEDPTVALAEVHDRLFKEPWTFDFFQAVRLLERLQPERSAVGRYAHPKDEIVRFQANPTLSFPASQIAALQTEPAGQPVMDINFLGLVGPLGVLPTFMTELVIARTRAKDHTLLSFLNIFNHRLTSFFYQAWEKHHFTVAYERDQNDPVTECLFSLVGFGTPGLRHRQPVPDEAFIFYSGLFALMPRSATALQAVLSDYFHVPVEVEPFIGAWRTLEPDDQCIFDQGPMESVMLGFGAVVGDEVWDQQSRVRLRLGPLSGERYEDFLPTGSAWPQIKALTKTFYGNEVEFELQLILKRADVPSVELHNPDDGALCLGWHTWLKSTPNFGRDPGDTILLLSEA
ncbi:MAG: type VI secretion system baseplate subunit TssG [Bryobacterales bacterium]|nr:type VI secretion system baseplate subunit TssG [Bryobacterales bacterium]